MWSMSVILALEKQRQGDLGLRLVLGSETEDSLGYIMTLSPQKRRRRRRRKVKKY